MAGQNKPLSQLRVEIDDVDDKLLDLLNRRASLAKQVAETKQATGGQFYVPSRERAIIDRLQAKNSGPFPDHALRPVFQEVISACLSLEAALTVAYLGPEATFTHQAVKRHFGSAARTLPCGSIPAVFNDVAKGAVEFGVVPVENSTEGVVNHTLDSFVDGTLSIAAEIIVDVDHCLMARPEVETSAITHVYSHPQALAQCRQWLDANLGRAVRVEAPSTAAAAQMAASDPEGAAIAAELAARMYNLRVLRHKLQDVANNATRFLVVSRDGKAPPPSLEGPGQGAYKTSLLLSLPDQAGALYAILQPITEAGINLTKIESRPTKQKAWDYVFFLDLDGHIDDPAVAGVLDALGEICELCKVLGCYRKADVVGSETDE